MKCDLYSEVSLHLGNVYCKSRLYSQELLRDHLAFTEIPFSLRDILWFRSQGNRKGIFRYWKV